MCLRHQRNCAWDKRCRSVTKQQSILEKDPRTFLLGLLKVALLSIAVALIATRADAQTPTVSIENVTRGGTSDFYVGDTWNVTITGGAPSAEVDVCISSGCSPEGYTDVNGNFLLPGYMSGGDIGTWSETWSVAGVIASPDPLTFNVYDGGQGGIAVVTAQLFDITNAALTPNINSGDQWELDITGPPNEPVTITGSLNGSAPGSPALLGMTDASGSLIITGVMDDSTIGDWTEVVFVGGVDGSPFPLDFAVNPAGTQPTYLAVAGVTAIAYLDESNISTYSATETNYQLAAYYDSYVESYLYQDGNQIAWGSADSGSGNSIAYGYLNQPVSPGSYYQIWTNHYLVAPQIFYDGGYYYYNPDGFGFIDGGGSDNETYVPVGGSIYVTDAYIYLGSTGDDAYTPSYYLNSTEIQEIVPSWTFDPGSGGYTVQLTGPALGDLVDLGFLDGATVEDLQQFTCPIPSPVCLVVNGAKVVVVAVIAGEAIHYLWRLWHSREASPVGWPGFNGDSPNLPDGWDVEVDPKTGKAGDYVKHNPDGSTEKLHPDLGDSTHGPHWDYNKYGPGGNQGGRIFPDENGPGGWIEWTKK